MNRVCIRGTIPPEEVGRMEEMEFKSKLEAMSERERLQYLLKLLEEGNTEEAKEIIKTRIATITSALEES